MNWSTLGTAKDQSDVEKFLWNVDIASEITSGDVTDVKELSNTLLTLLISTCSHVAKSIAKHDFDIANPPFLRCVDPMCNSTFVTYAQYHLHHVHNPRQLGYR